MGLAGQKGEGEAVSPLPCGSDPGIGCVTDTGALILVPPSAASLLTETEEALLVRHLLSSC